jgi:hypothetical protein
MAIHTHSTETSHPSLLAGADGPNYTNDSAIMDERWIQSLIVGNTESSIPRKRKGKDEDQGDGIIVHDNIHKHASFELPLELTEDGLKVLKDAQVSVLCSMPPSRINGRWSGTLEGHSSLVGSDGTATSNSTSTSTATATGSVSLNYKATSWGNASFGMIRGHEPHYPLLSIGGTLLRQGSAVGVTLYHNPSFLLPPKLLFEHSMYSLSFRHLFPDSRWLLTSQLSRSKELSLSLSNSKIEGAVEWNLQKLQDIRLRLDVRPKLSVHRRAHIYCQWKPSASMWQVGVSLVQSLHSQLASVGVGLSLLSSRGLEWVFSWNRGDASIRIPIVISRTLDTASLGQALYLSLFSFLIQEALADMWGWKNTTPSEPNTTTPDAAFLLSKIDHKESLEKLQEDAEMQRQLMMRQAKRKTREEEEKDGLVIHQAVYEVHGGDSLDVTVQLQFWVSSSSLSLPATSKQELLGIYSVAATAENNETSVDSANAKQEVAVPWWRDLWDDLLWDSATRATKDKVPPGPVPTLTVRYEFKGQPFQITIQDHEALKLPTPHATSWDRSSKD